MAQMIKRRWLATIGLPGAWMLLFFVAPLLGILWVSFLSRGDYGELQFPLTFENYRRVAGFGLLGFDPLYPAILGRSLLLAGLTAFFCVAFALPIAFWIAGLPGRWKTFGLMLVVIPFWTNLLVRTYAWQILLGPEGWVTHVFAALGLVGANEALYPSGTAVLLCLVCDYLPFSVLPIYAAVERLNWELPEAARDLGANAAQVFRHGIFPQIKLGIYAAAALVFLPATGQFVIPDLLGGAKTALLGNLLQQQFGGSRDWPFGSAIATVSMLIVMAAVFWQARRGRSLEPAAKEELE
jgi:spermidine/putrescine transport system permease protein